MDHSDGHRAVWWRPPEPATRLAPAQGSFLTQDPIGLAGGVNPYSYAGSDPIAFSDPFGLKVCATGKNQEDLDKAKKAIGDATDTDITWDKGNCVESFKRRGNAKFAEIQEAFRHMVFSGKVTFDFHLSDDLSSEQFDPLAVTVFRKADQVGYNTGEWGKCDGGGESFTLGQVFAHEILHHGPVAFGKPMNRSERFAIVHGDNVYNSQRGKAPRCDHGGF